ncbi:hypothetical protein EJB05_11030, partial [Eragrostis curvula]
MTYVPPGGAWAQGAAALALVPKAQAAGGDLFPEAYSRRRPCSRWSWESTSLGLGLLAKAAPPSTSALATSGQLPAMCLICRFSCRATTAHQRQGLSSVAGPIDASVRLAHAWPFLLWGFHPPQGVEGRCSDRQPD